MAPCQSMPASPQLKDVAPWFISRLPSASRRLLEQAAAAAKRRRRPLRVATLCSGTDAPVPVFTHLSKTMGIEIEHVFSCENDPRKQKWISESFPAVKLLFSDVREVGAGQAVNVLTGEKVAVPPVDVVVAGFVCKSVSSENNNRVRFKHCIDEGSGSTGVTFSGVQAYVSWAKPSLVICENVVGLTKRNGGQEPQIESVANCFRQLGYAFGWACLNSRDYVLPHRRQRCWMWSFRDRTNVHELAAETLVPQTLAALRSARHMKFGRLLNRRALGTKPKLNARKRRVVRKARRIHAVKDHPELFVDVGKTEKRCVTCVGALPCIVPNSEIYSVQEGRILDPREVCAAQGIFTKDFPAMPAFLKRSPRLVRDLAGNAFTTTVCMVVAMATLPYAILSDTAVARVEPLAQRKRKRGRAVA